MRFRRLLAILAVFIAFSGGSWAEQRYARLTILHTNDTHSHLLPFSYPTTFIPERGAKPLNLPAYQNVGGIARRATIIKRENMKDGVLVLDAGDVIDGSPFSIEFKGEADFAALNATGYEVMVTGNHEYGNNLEDFNKRLREAHFPVLGANVFKSDGSPFLIPYVILNEAGLRTAVLGLVVPNNYAAVKEGKLTIKDPVEVAKEWVPKLRQMADVVILLTHIGFEDDERLARQVPGIDVIIGGHSHTRVPKPVLVKSKLPPRAFWVGGTVVAQDFQWGGELGEVDLTFHKDDTGWSLMSFDGRLIPITSDIPEDPSVRAVVEKYHKRIAAKYDEVIGEATADFIEEAPVNMVSDVLRETYNADFAVHNDGAVRADLVKGPITIGDIAMLFPFSDWVQTFHATGAQIKDILLSKPAVSGIKYKIEGGKLVSAEIGGKPIEDAQIYKGVTHVFYAENAIPKEITMEDGKAWVRDLIIKWIKQKKTISPDNEYRAQF
ncbi:MAG TPA: bifunctional UDP-sugar hydrolase/5'-nucleotidase [Armatimonadota bacterium]|nr:bifunctional UDP-sugar hydrolase/5'-nucleotidase [Armatimonadota bacterium]